MVEYTLAELIKVVNDLNNLKPPFDPPLNNKETDVSKVVAEIKLRCEELDYEDEIPHQSKIIVSKLCLGIIGDIR